MASIPSRPPGNCPDPDRSVAEAWRRNSAPLAAWAGKNLVTRRDAHGQYLPVESRKPGGEIFTAKAPATAAVLQKHFEGRSTGDIIGLHSTVRDEAEGQGEVASCWSRWGAVDIDRHDESTDPEATLKAAVALHDRAVDLGFDALLLDSNGGGGYHLILLFSTLVPTGQVFAFLKWLVRDWRDLGLEGEPETFPKQAAIAAGGYGNWLRLPGRHHTRDHWSKVWRRDQGWLEGQPAIRAILATAPSPPGVIPPEALDPPKRPRKAKGMEQSDPARDAALAAKAISYLDPSMPYPEWLEVGMSLTQLGREGLYLWDRWSAESEKYQEGICDRKWRSFARPAGGKTLGTLFHLAKSKGFEFPKGQESSQSARGRLGNSPDEAEKPTLRVVGGAIPEREQRDDRAASARLPMIVVDTDEFAVNNSAIGALSADMEVYCRGNYLVTVKRDAASDKLITRPPESPRIAAMPKASIRERLSKNASWVKLRKNPKSGEIAPSPAHPPDWSTAAIEARGAWPGVRPLEGVIESPIMRPDGSILDVPGYDEMTGLLYEPNCTYPEIPKRITKGEAAKAAEKLLEIVADFPFAIIKGKDEDAPGDGGMAHRAAWLAGLLTPLGRYAIAGPCPLFLADANVSAAGKSKLCDIVAIVATGRKAARTACPDSDEEMRKQILSIAIEGDRMILVDNVATGSSLGFASLDACLTGTSVKGRILGKTEMSREVPIYTVWFATGNNITLKGDMLRRVCSYRIESPEERPEERRGFRIEGDILDHVLNRRGELVVAALTILRGYILAGRPEADLIPMDYPAWCRVVRQAIHWAIGIDPCTTRRELIADDPETNLFKGLVQGWAELPGGSHGLTAAEVIRILGNADHLEKFQKLREVLLEWSKDGKLPSPVSIGKRLKAVKGRVIDGLTLKSLNSHGTYYWRVVEARSGGDGGDGGG